MSAVLRPNAGPLLEACRSGASCWPAAEPEEGSVLLLAAPQTGERDCSRREVWRSYVGIERVRSVYEWMSARSEEWDLWGRVATLFGDTALHAIVVEAAEREAEAAALEAENARLKEEERLLLSRKVELYILDAKGKRPGISLESGHETKPFFVMRFSEKWERERVLDWLRWQKDRYLDFRDLCEAEGQLALERVIIAGMRETEAQMKAQRRTSGGRRPLRFWRGEA